MFLELNLTEEIVKALELNGYHTPTEVQSQCIPPILEGKDIVGRSVTGSGKTFAFGLPAIQMIDTAENSVQVLVVCPTRELCLQVTDEIRKVSGYLEGRKTVPVYGGANINRQITALKGAKIVVGTPGRLMDHLRRRTLKLHKLKMVVLDEADEMLNMGFRDDIESILKYAPPKRQTVMFSATVPAPIKAIMRKYMNAPEYIAVGEENSTIDEIEQRYIRVSGMEKCYAIVELFRRLSPKRAIIFCNTKRMVDVLNSIMNESGFNALALHGDMAQPQRKRVMDALKKHQSPFLIATDVAARGIDIEDVEYIFNFDLPLDMESYIHRIGRTGRAGKSGKAISFIGNQDELILLSDIMTSTRSYIDEHEMAESIEKYAVMMMKERPRAFPRPPRRNNRRPSRSAAPRSARPPRKQ